MSDPFAFLNPIEKPKNAAPAYVPPPAPVASLHPEGTPGFGGPGAPGMGMNMGMPPMGMGMGAGMPGGMGLGMAPGMPGMGGMPSGMGMGMGPGVGGMPAMPGMGMGQPPQQQAPIMYDNIKNLLQQKPKPTGSMRDDTSMDFLENLGTAKVNSVSVTSPTAAAASPFAPTADPFGGPAPAAPAPIAAPVISLAGFEFSGESSASTSSSTSNGTVSPSNGAKSSALAERLANGRRKTQEAQRQQLGFSAGAFTQSGAAPKISLKELAPQPKNSSGVSAAGDRESRAPSLEDFASGKPVFSDADPFGASSTGSSSRTDSNTAAQGQSKASYSGGGSIFADSDADFDSKLNGGTDGGSYRHASSGNLGGARTGSGGAAAKNTMDFGW